MLEVTDLVKHFKSPGGLFRRAERVMALDGVTLSVPEGETLGVVGESGCGKSTLARAILRLHEPDSGRVTIHGTDWTALKRKELGRKRVEAQIVFQDPYASLDPRMTVESTLSEPLIIHRKRNGLRMNASRIGDRVAELLTTVGMSPAFAKRYPHEFSGGQRQRIGIARALALNPRLLLLDEPVSALDVSIQAQVLNLLARLQRDLGLTYVFISHDLAVVRHISDRVAVMYLGRVVELSPADPLYRKPLHPYTKALLSNHPVPDPVRERSEKRRRERILLPGELRPRRPEDRGCRFRERCHLQTELCGRVEPALEEKEPGRFSACHHWDNV
jgi:oligopeptide/dipeptide ABC transporter ATP-binding protein